MRNRVRKPYRPTPEQQRDWSLRKNYGVTLEQFRAMVARQRGLCAICAKDVTANSRTCHLDHDHKTGAVRGILCAGCNTAVGHIERAGIESFASYLAHPPAQSPDYKECWR